MCHTHKTNCSDPPCIQCQWHFLSSSFSVNQCYFRISICYFFFLPWSAPGSSPVWLQSSTSAIAAGSSSRAGAWAASMNLATGWGTSPSKVSLAVTVWAGWFWWMEMGVERLRYDETGLDYCWAVCPHTFNLLMINVAILRLKIGKGHLAYDRGGMKLKSVLCLDNNVSAQAYQLVFPGIPSWYTSLMVRKSIFLLKNTFKLNPSFSVNRLSALEIL